MRRSVLSTRCFRKIEPSRPDHRELDLVNMAFAHGMERDAVIGELLARPGHVLCITREPVECLASDHVDLACFHCAQKVLQPQAVAAIARQFGIRQVATTVSPR